MQSTLPSPLKKATKHRILAIFNEFHRPEFIGLDPLVTLGRFSRQDDLECAGLVAAVLSYGRVETIIKNVQELFNRLPMPPGAFLNGTSFKEKKRCLRGFKHRFNTGDDLALLLQALGRLVADYGSIERFFTETLQCRAGGIRTALSLFSEALAGHAFRWQHSIPKSFRFLIPSPQRGGACKRSNMYLRWMVRPADGIDLGVWKSVKPSVLMMPVDTHIASVAKRLGLTARNTADWRMAEEVTAGLRLIDPTDPVRFDFSLCRSGMVALRKVAA